MPEECVGDRLRLQGALGPVLHGRGEAEGATESRETIVNPCHLTHCDSIILQNFVISVI